MFFGAEREADRMGAPRGIHPHTAVRWFGNGTLPAPAERVEARTMLVNIGGATADPAGHSAGRVRN